MNNDEQNIKYLFEKNFERVKKQRIVLYGHEAAVNLILRCFPMYNIIGVIVENQKAVSFGEKKILREEDLPKLQVDLVIPLVLPEELEGVFQKLYLYCFDYHIQIYSLDGKNLFEIYKIQKNMLEEIPEFVRIFRNRFKDCINKKIAIYGKGPRTRILIELCREFHFVGIMDRELKSGNYYGKPILDYGDVVAEGIELIVVVSKDENHPYIFNRIYEFCSYYHIQLYNVEGNDLYQMLSGCEGGVESHPYYGVSEEDLITQLNVHEVIVFGVFDVLVMYKICFSNDLVSLIKKRVEAQQIGNENKKKLVELENQEKRKLLVVRSKMIELMNYAIQSGKEVYVMEETDIPSEMLEGWLSDLNIRGYKELIVFTEKMKTDLVCKLEDMVQNSKCLYVGVPRSKQIFDKISVDMDTFWIKEVLSLLDISSYALARCYAVNLNERSILGLFAARMFANPFSLYQSGGRREINHIYDLGYAFVGPLITKYMLWFIDELKKCDYDEVLFAARDGYLIMKLYRKLREMFQIDYLPEGIYFQTSRHAAVCASMRTEKDIEWIASCPQFSDPETVIHLNFDLPREEILPYDAIKYPDMISYAMAQKEQIYANSKKLAKNYMCYIEKIGLQPNKKYALWDFVSSGTCHYCLNKFVPFKLEGMYVCNYDGYKDEWRALKAKGMFIQNRVVGDNTFSAYSNETYFYKNYLFLENAITSYEPTLTGFTENGEPVLAKETRTARELQFVADMQAGIEDFFDDYMKNLYVPDSEINEKLVDRLYSFKDLRYTNEQCEYLDDFFLREDMLHTTISLCRK